MPEFKRDSKLRESISSEIRSKFANISTSSVSASSSTLPLELWRVVLSYLSTRDLCRCSQTCRDWNELVNSLDSTRWRDLFLQQKSAKRWKHPNWPNATHIDPKSWQNTYKIHSLAARQWLRTSMEASCTFYGGLFGIFRGPKQRKVIHVGRDRRYVTINRAISAARPFDTIVLEPNHYQQFPLALKFPVEIVGTGDPSKVVITMLIEHTATSARFANVMFKPSYPRQRGRGASSLLIKVRAFLHSFLVPSLEYSKLYYLVYVYQAHNMRKIIFIVFCYYSVFERRLHSILLIFHLVLLGITWFTDIAKLAIRIFKFYALQKPYYESFFSLVFMFN